MSSMAFCSLLMVILMDARFAAKRICPNQSPLVWFSNDRYIELVVLKDGTWNEAKNDCTSKGGYFADISSRQDNSIIWEALKTDGYFGPHGGIWIGLTDGFEEGNWQWTSSHFGNNFTNWAPNQPEQNIEVANTEDCALMESDGKWHDYPCDSKHGWVCKYTNFNGCPPGHDIP